MIKHKISSLLLFILLFCNNLGFSQSGNLYLDKITENSDKYKTFQKNFNLLKCEPAVLKSCFIEMVDDLRLQLFGCKAFVNLPMLDSVAKMQADYQAEKDKLTDINEPPFQYTAQRLKQYGFTVQGAEIVAKAKAHQGDHDYSYYDVCIELMKILLKTSSSTPAILSPQYTICGFAFAIDKNYRSVYISFVLGNDMSNQVFNSAISKQRDLPISKGNAGLSFYDEAICKKCAEDHALEQIYDMLYWNEDGDVFLQSDDAKLVKRLLTKAGNAIVLDFIQKEQYNCRVPQVDHNKPFRGIVAKPVAMEKILAANDSTPKSNLFHAKIGAIPPQIENTKPIDINILLLNGKKTVCRTLIRKNVQNIATSDIAVNDLIAEQNYEAALYRLSPMLADSTINEAALFAIVQLAAHKEKTYLSSIFTQAVQMALQRNPQKLCTLLDEFSVAVFDNTEVKKIYCNTCK
jgi:hypothetical protein